MYKRLESVIVRCEGESNCDWEFNYSTYSDKTKVIPVEHDQIDKFYAIEGSPQRCTDDNFVHLTDLDLHKLLHDLWDLTVACLRYKFDVVECEFICDKTPPTIEDFQLYKTTYYENNY